VHRAAVEVAAEVPLALELSLAEEATPVFAAPHGHWMACGKVCCDCLMREERCRREPRGGHAMRTFLPNLSFMVLVCARSFTKKWCE
jgi:hypothetical protein